MHSPSYPARTVAFRCTGFPPGWGFSGGQVKCRKEFAGKKYGYSGKKIGNVHLKWAFSEATVTFMGHNEKAKQFVARKERNYGKGKAMAILSAKLGRAVYWMLRRKEAFDQNVFFAS